MAKKTDAERDFCRRWAADLSRRLDALGLTPDWLVREIGVSDSTFRGWRAGRQVPSVYAAHLATQAVAVAELSLAVGGDL